MQALSEEDRRLWMEAMDGREPVCRSFTFLFNRIATFLYLSWSEVWNLTWCLSSEKIRLKVLLTDKYY